MQVFLVGVQVFIAGGGLGSHHFQVFEAEVDEFFVGEGVFGELYHSFEFVGDAYDEPVEGPVVVLEVFHF